MSGRAILTMCVVALSVGAMPAGAATDPAPLVLQVSDLPDGFTQSQVRYRSNATTAKENAVTVAVLRGWGRITGYQAVYDREVDPSAPPDGPVTVTTNVSTYRAGPGLRRAFLRSAASIEGSGTPQPVFRRRPLKARVGDETRLYWAGLTQNGIPVVIYAVVWRTKGALGYLNVAGVKGHIAVKDVLALARRQQARMTGTAKPQPGDGGEVI